MKRLSQNGFSLIELIFALAIGGLILVIVFYSLAQATRNKRDDARKEDAHRYLLAAKEWSSDNNGILPDNVDTTDPKCPPTGGITSKDYQCVIYSYITNYYLDNSGNPHGPSTRFNDPDGNPWAPVWGTGAAGVNPQMLVQSQASCGSGGQIVAASGSRQIAVAVQLQDGGSYCASN